MAVAGLAVFVLDYGHDRGEDARRVAIVTALKTQAEDYHQEKGEYPPLEKLSPPHQEMLPSYLASRVVFYWRDPSGQNYVVKTIFTGPFTSKDGKFSVSWEGMQYSNNQELIKENNDSWETNRYGFYLWDLH
ncbi:MAG: hypothetical protein KQJ78_21225 [Deltaproteobacteria bacterium]|nr:hypothetical protein [Deltaproteobacteria bacterium]